VGTPGGDDCQFFSIEIETLETLEEVGGVVLFGEV